MRSHLLNFTRKYCNRIVCPLLRYKRVSKFIFNKSKCVTASTILQCNGKKYIFTSHGSISNKEEDVIALEKELHYNSSSILKDMTDPIIQQLDKCASAEEALTVFKTNKLLYKTHHISQTVQLLYDFHKICDAVSGEEATQEFERNLLQHEEFSALLKQVVENVNKFDIDNLNNIHYYLHKIGVNFQDPFLETVTLNMRKKLVDNFSLSRCSKFLSVVRSDSFLRPFIISEQILPIIISQIDTCTNVEELGLLANCLNKINLIITEETAIKFSRKVRQIVNSENVIDKHVFLLQIISFLNHYHWRHKCSFETSYCISLLDGQVDRLSIKELIFLYRVFYKILEPGTILNTLQRCSSKLLQSDEIITTNINTKLELFSSLIFFSSPQRRKQYKPLVEKYVHASKTLSSLLLVKRILTVIKTSDRKLCDLYWDKMLALTRTNKNIDTILTTCEQYATFYTDLNNYRHHLFEKEMMNYLKSIKSSLLSYFPSIVCAAFSFSVVYGNNNELNDYFLNKLSENYTQLNHSDCLNLSYTLAHLNDSNHYKSKLVDVFKKAVIHQIEYNCNDYTVNHLIKASVLLNDIDITKQLLNYYCNNEPISSKTIEICTHIFKTTRILIPELLNKLTAYVIANENNVLGFNAEKLLYICYYLGYCPQDSQKFFEISTNIIIRDQERLSGLSFLNSTLSLCFFNQLPSSFVKAVFNVEFMEKLDSELENCYSKDSYPQKVRNTLMKLNRAVCLEYPEYNVPWFHENYVNDQKKMEVDLNTKASADIKNIINILIEEPEYLTENNIVPYGYYIDYILRLNNDGKVVSPDSDEISTKLAILILTRNAFTESFVQLKGAHQLKKRHLEMLGFTVLIIKSFEWKTLVHTKQKMDFVSSLLNLNRQFR